MTGRYSNPAIFILKYQVQIVAFCSPQLFAKFAKPSLYIRMSIISDKISILWIALNLLNL